MSREIKFHVIVTGNTGEKVAEFHEWLDSDGWKHDYYAPLVSNGVFSHEELGDGWMGKITRRQFTGLPDKNGKEIYEGDIVSFPDMGEDGYEYQEGYDFTNRALVVFEDARFKLGRALVRDSVVFDEMHESHDDFIGVFKESEVIGNIDENPELLK